MAYLLINYILSKNVFSGTTGNPKGVEVGVLFSASCNLAKFFSTDYALELDRSAGNQQTPCASGPKR